MAGGFHTLLALADLWVVVLLTTGAASAGGPQAVQRFFLVFLSSNGGLEGWTLWEIGAKVGLRNLSNPSGWSHSLAHSCSGYMGTGDRGRSARRLLNPASRTIYKLAGVVFPALRLRSPARMNEYRVPISF